MEERWEHQAKVSQAQAYSPVLVSRNALALFNGRLDLSVRNVWEHRLERGEHPGLPTMKKNEQTLCTKLKSH
jgi:hypothetical protein